jgi:hypothetical protein
VLRWGPTSSGGLGGSSAGTEAAPPPSRVVHRLNGNLLRALSWFKLGFPSGYVTDVLQVLEVLTELGHGDDPRLDAAKTWLRGQRGADGRWRNRFAYSGKTIVEIERQGAPPTWVTLRALTVLKPTGPPSPWLKPLGSPSAR